MCVCACVCILELYDSVDSSWHQSAQRFINWRLVSGQASPIGCLLDVLVDDVLELPTVPCNEQRSRPSRQAPHHKVSRYQGVWSASLIPSFLFLDLLVPMQGSRGSADTSAWQVPATWFQAPRTSSFRFPADLSVEPGNPATQPVSIWWSHLPSRQSPAPGQDICLKQVVSSITRNGARESQSKFGASYWLSPKYIRS